jgi:thiol-disulfide isomerase/thioredoxin
MIIDVVEFRSLEKKMSSTQKQSIDFLAPTLGKAYVVTITRDGCPACEKQKPKLDELAASAVKKYGDRVVFTRIHINYSSDSVEESLRSKTMFKHYFYPTNLILLRTVDRGAIEYYRNVAPEMKEIDKNLQHAVEVAAMLAEQTN